MFWSLPNFRSGKMDHLLTKKITKIFDPLQKRKTIVSFTENPLFLKGINSNKNVRDLTGICFSRCIKHMGTSTKHVYRTCWKTCTSFCLTLDQILQNHVLSSTLLIITAQLILIHLKWKEIYSSAGSSCVNQSVNLSNFFVKRALVLYHMDTYKLFTWLKYQCFVCRKRLLNNSFLFSINALSISLYINYKSCISD